MEPAITISQFDKTKYNELLVLPHSELGKFVRQNLRLKTWITATFLLLHILIVLAIVFIGYLLLNEGSVTFFDDIVAGLGIGFWIAILIAFFLHETTHLLAYKILGSKRSTIKFHKNMFLALSYDAVLNARQFYFLAILPFAILTPILLAICFFLQGYWLFATLGVLFLHTAGCSGDFALVNWFYINRDKEIYTYDDVVNKISYFYTKK